MERIFSCGLDKIPDAVRSFPPGQFLLLGRDGEPLSAAALRSCLGGRSDLTTRYDRNGSRVRDLREAQRLLQSCDAAHEIGYELDSTCRLLCIEVEQCSDDVPVDEAPGLVHAILRARGGTYVQEAQARDGAPGAPRRALYRVWYQLEHEFEVNQRHGRVRAYTTGHRVSLTGEECPCRKPYVRWLSKKDARALIQALTPDHDEELDIDIDKVRRQALSAPNAEKHTLLESGDWESKYPNLESALWSLCGRNKHWIWHLYDVERGMDVVRATVKLGRRSAVWSELVDERGEEEAEALLHWAACFAEVEKDFYRRIVQYPRDHHLNRLCEHLRTPDLRWMSRGFRMEKLLKRLGNRVHRSTAFRWLDKMGDGGQMVLLEGDIWKLTTAGRRALRRKIIALAKAAASGAGRTRRRSNQRRARSTRRSSRTRTIRASGMTSSRCIGEV